MSNYSFTSIVSPDVTPSGTRVFSALCPELDIASQGETESEAYMNLKEAVELFLENVAPNELKLRLAEGAKVSPLDLAA